MPEKLTKPVLAVLENGRPSRRATMGQTSATFCLREMRERAGMTQASLADLVCCQPHLISQYERGQIVPRFDRATDIAIALGCSLDELAGIEQDNEMRASHT